jgi:hypothetical protein
MPKDRKVEDVIFGKVRGSAKRDLRAKSLRDCRDLIVFGRDNDPSNRR